MIMVRGVDKPYFLVLFLYVHLVAGHQLTDDLAVTGQVGAVNLRRADDDFHHAVAVDHHRPVTQGVRADRHQHQRVQRRMQYRSAARQRISG